MDVTAAFREAFPAAHIGLLTLEGVANPASHPGLEDYARQVEGRLRQRFAGADRSVLNGLPVIEAYQRHYRAFGQTYHVLRQLESVALKGKALSSGSALVLAMFAVELETLLLTAGHDLDAVRPPLTVDSSRSGERFIGIGGQEYVLRSNDMLIRDAEGIISAVICGPDLRTRLGDETRRALFTTYAPDGIDATAVRSHLEQLASAVQVVTPSATVQMLAVT